MTAYRPLQLSSAALGALTDLSRLRECLERWERGMGAILDRGIRFEDNMDARIISVTSHATPGTEFSTANTLGKVPVGYLVIGQDGAGSIYDGATTNTVTTLFFKSDIASKSFRVIVF